MGPVRRCDCVFIVFGTVLRISGDFGKSASFVGQVWKVIGVLDGLKMTRTGNTHFSRLFFRSIIIQTVLLEFQDYNMKILKKTNRKAFLLEAIYYNTRNNSFCNP